ncbi:hypothetical protein B0T24DRAFT_346345 [Lasiosphaeria ovina]|uniref:Uncharacterized protein n=1 Tax=Lasiosphaeria ovina TaxID=92902 RepID=A0AAE0N3K9_9PEZI|nr:hypothetical protein B0T24DRAFT_346345 [Lasiosphaeria ovina]
MALINPVHGLVVPFLCMFTIPLAIFAGITTALAFSVLMFRVAIVYLDIALAFIPQYFVSRSRPRILSSSAASGTGNHGHQHTYSRDGRRTSVSPPGSVGSGSGYSTPSPVSPFPSSTSQLHQQHHLGLGGHRSPNHHRRKSSYGFGAAMRARSRHSSQVSLASIGTITPIHEDEVTPLVTESGLTPSVGMDRDFEGIGGWRLDDDGDDANWANINSRLELPLERSSSRRSQSAGPVTPGEGTWLMMKGTHQDSQEDKDWERHFHHSSGKGLMSPNSSRLRSMQMPAALTTLTKEHTSLPI